MPGRGSPRTLEPAGRVRRRPGPVSRTQTARPLSSGLTAGTNRRRPGDPAAGVRAFTVGNPQRELHREYQGLSSARGGTGAVSTAAEQGGQGTGPGPTLTGLVDTSGLSGAGPDADPTRKGGFDGRSPADSGGGRAGDLLARGTPKGRGSRRETARCVPAGGARWHAPCPAACPGRPRGG